QRGAGAVPRGGEKTHAPAGSGTVLVAAIGGASVEATTVVAVVGGAVLVGEPIGGRVAVLGAPSSVLHAVTRSMMPITVMPDIRHPKGFIASNRRSLVAGC